MTGNEHFKAAERAIDRADRYLYGDASGTTDGLITGLGYAQLATAHATLALAAATRPDVVARTPRPADEQEVR